MKKLKRSLPGENPVKDKLTVKAGNSRSSRPLSAAWFLLLLVPIALTVTLAVLRYPGLPEKIVTHYNFNGVADAWETKSVILILGPIFSQVVFAGLMFLIGLFSRSTPASFRGNPGAAPGYALFRRLISLIIIAIALVIETNFLVTELIYLDIIHSMQAGTVITSTLIVLLAIALITVFIRSVRSKKATGPRPGGDNKWKLGLIYFNPSDPSLLVKRRNGIGRTINFGRPTAWIIIAAIILIILYKL